MTLIPPRSDPVGDKYYSTVKVADKAADWLFYLAAALSIAVLFLEKDASPALYRITMTSFVVSVLALFVIGLTTRLHWTPRAEDKRRLDFFTSALNVSLTHQTSLNYYNNNVRDPSKRMAAQLLENAHFTHSIALSMAPKERLRAIGYGTAWFLCLMLPNADLGLIAAATQAVFGEQILSRWLRLEWLRSRSERIFDEVRQMFAGNTSDSSFNALTLNSLTNYETAKAIAGITLSSDVFNRENPRLSAEWENIKKSIGI